MKNKKAFTLIEILLVIIILGLLIGVLFKTYITISQISFRTEQEKYLHQELLFVSETLQNLANRNEIDYTKYNLYDVVSKKGMVDMLYLTGEDGEVVVYSTGNCGNGFILDTENPCSLSIKTRNSEFRLIDFGIQTSKALFKIIPYADNQSYVDFQDLCSSNYIACLHDQGFWFFITLFAKGYSTANWTTNISVFVQQFFNI